MFCLSHLQVQGAVADEIGSLDLKAPFAATELLSLISRLHDRLSDVVSEFPLRCALGTDRVDAMEAARGEARQSFLSETGCPQFFMATGGIASLLW